MSMPRKAMHALGFQACCLRCDAPDGGSERRCTACIDHHRTVRETVASASPDDPLFQLAKELMAMAAAPHRYDHDEVHGASLREQQRLATELVGTVAPLTEEDVLGVFEEQRARKKVSPLRPEDNPNAQGDENAQPILSDMSERYFASAQGVDTAHYGARTVPSRPIASVDRSDRLGEDTALTDRIHAASTIAEKDEEAQAIFEEIDFQRRQRQRAELNKALQDAKELVDDDLDFE